MKDKIINTDSFSDNFKAGKRAGYIEAMKDVPDKLVKCTNCGEMAEMISLGEFCSKCMC